MSRSITACSAPRFAVQSSDAFAKAIGYPRAPIDDLLVFHIVFGKTVPDVSLNAVANLGYAGCYFRTPVYPGDTLTALSEVIGLKENSSRKTGIVYVRTTGYKQDGTAGARICALGDGAQSATKQRRRPAITCRACRPWSIPKCSAKPVRRSTSRPTTSRSPAARIASATMQVGERIDHVDGITVEEAEHHDRDAALSEHRAHPFRPVRRQARAASAAG